MRQLVAFGSVHQGRIALDDKPSFDAAVAQLETTTVRLTIDVGDQRTAAQNRFFHGPILKAFIELGWRKQEAKDMLCLRFIPQECRQLDGSVVLVPGHTSTPTVTAFNELIDACIQLAAENDIYIQDADEWRAAHRDLAQEATA